MTFEKSEETPSTETTPSTDSTEIVVNGRTYKSVEEVTKKIENADQHINNLEAEARDKDATMLDLIAKIQGIEGKIDNNASIGELIAKMSKPEEAPPQEPSPETQEISKEELVAAAKDAIKQEQLEEQQESNLSAALQAAEKKFGEDYKNKVVEKAAEVGISAAEVDRMAKLSPQAFTALFIGESETAPAPTKTTVDDNITGLQERTPDKKRFMSMNSKARSAFIAAQLTELTEGK